MNRTDLTDLLRGRRELEKLFVVEKLFDAEQFFENTSFEKSLEEGRTSCLLIATVTHE